MAQSPTVREEIAAFTVRRAHRRLRWLVVPVVAAAAALLFVPTVVASPWAPVIHWGCQRGGLVGSGEYEVPLVVANSPYGGMVWANGTGLTPTTVTASNGAAVGGFVAYHLELFRTRNLSLPGPGVNHVCLARFQLVLQGVAPAPVALVALLAPGSVSDRGEPGSVPVSSGLPYPSLGFVSGYTSATGGSLTTCGSSSPRSLSVASIHLAVSVTLSVYGRPVTVTASIVDPATFHYWFPANFGTWSVDQLSGALGTPGGGDAFAFVPCGTPPAA
jgi:hypothetical protein